MVVEFTSVNEDLSAGMEFTPRIGAGKRKGASSSSSRRTSSRRKQSEENPTFNLLKKMQYLISKDGLQHKITDLRAQISNEEHSLKLAISPRAAT